MVAAYLQDEKNFELILEFTAGEVLTHSVGAPSPARIAARRPLLQEDLCNGWVNPEFPDSFTILPGYNIRE